MSILLAVDDGWTSGNLNMADLFFLLGMILAAVSGLGYAAGVGTIARVDEDPTPPDGTTTAVPVTTPTRTWHYHLHQWAAALAAFAVASVAFGLFLL